MYAVVGCSDCSALWVVADRPDTSQCPRCGTRHRYDLLREFVTTDDENHAREVRASMLANRSDEGDAFAELDAFDDLEDDAMAAGIDAETYLESAGIDPDETAAAGERAADGTASTGTSKRETVLAGLEELDEPTEAALVEYAADRGVDSEYVRRSLEKLRRAGEVAKRDGQFRLL
jgi:hypothetical protein